MTQQVQVYPTESDDLVQFPRTHLMKQEEGFTHTHTDTHTHPHTHRHVSGETVFSLVCYSH